MKNKMKSIVIIVSLLGLGYVLEISSVLEIKKPKPVFIDVGDAVPVFGDAVPATEEELKAVGIGVGNE